MNIRELLNHTLNAEQTEPAIVWDVTEKQLRQALLNGLVIKLTNACLWKEAETEMLVDVLQGEDDPRYVIDAITDARDRLAAADKLSADWKDACEHVQHFLEHRQELLAAKREEQKGTMAGEMDEIMRMLGVTFI